MTDEKTKNAIEWKERVMNSKEPYDPLITYYFVDKGLDMSAGKLGVQTARAGQVMMLGEMKQEDTLLFESLSELFEDDFMHGNKSICLKVNKNQMERILTGDINEKIRALSDDTGMPIRLYPVYDIGATEVAVNSRTVIAMTPVKASVIRPIVKKFQVY